MFLASLHIMMTLTNWYSPSENTITRLERSWPAVWIKMGSSSACLCLYLWTLLAPMLRLMFQSNVESDRQQSHGVSAHSNQEHGSKDSQKAGNHETKLEKPDNQPVKQVKKNLQRDFEVENNGDTHFKRDVEMEKEAESTKTANKPLSEADKEVLRLQGKVLRLQEKIAKLQHKVAELQGLNV